MQGISLRLGRAMICTDSCRLCSGFLYGFPCGCPASLVVFPAAARCVALHGVTLHRMVRSSPSRAMMEG